MGTIVEISGINDNNRLSHATDDDNLAESSNSFITSSMEEHPTSDRAFGIWWDNNPSLSIERHTEQELCITCRFRAHNMKKIIPGSIVCGCPRYGARVSTFGAHKFPLPNEKEQFGTIVDINSLDKTVRVVLDSDDKIRDFPIGCKNAFSLIYAKSSYRPKIGQLVISGMLGMMVSRNPLTSIHEPAGWGIIYAIDTLYFYVIWHKTHKSEKIQEWKCHAQTPMKEGSILRYVWPLLLPTTEAP